MTKLTILKMITFYSLQYGIDPKLAIAVAEHESSFNPVVIGVSGDVGVFQLRPSSFPNYSIKDLQNPRLNIELGVKYLAKMKRECAHQNNNDWLTCYNTGLTYAKNRIHHPSLFPYVLKVNELIALNN